MKTSYGLSGIAGIWLTMGFMPMVELLHLSAAEATLLRGLSGVVAIGFATLWHSRLVTMPDRSTLRVVFYFVVATFCLFQAVSAWGANYMALFLDLAVLVPLYFAWRRSTSIGPTTLLALVAAVVGTMLALRVFQGGVFQCDGFLWSVGALVANGLFIENLASTKQENWSKTFWLSAGLVCFGTAMMLLKGTFFNPELSNFDLSTWVVLAVLFSITTGALNFYFGFMAGSNLNAIAMGILVLGVTPTILLSSHFMLGKSMGSDQLIGVAITLFAAFVFGNALRKNNT